MPARLGPFLVSKPLGEGGMGVVYRGLHVDQKVPVAVKVDTNSSDPQSNAAFLHEVQITAALDHPNIVMILDHGVVSESASRESGGALGQGARWLAMELAGGGTAASHVPSTWQEVMHLVRGVLSGLAHAHARGVVHRDIKLDNILIAGEDPSTGTIPESLLEARIVLSDFGVSDIRDTPLYQSGRPIGTPEYMAPELIEGRWRDHGPWTDLYAVGVLLYLLTARDYPFKGGDRLAVYEAHLHQAAPPLMSMMPVPPGLNELIQRLLSKDPAERPEFAAELQRLLDGLGPAAQAQPAAALDLEDMPTVALPDLPSRTGRSYAGRSRRSLRAVPLLHSGRRVNARMHGAGLALFGLRSVPFVGRESERDQLWNDLVAVRATQGARCVFIQGPSGIGKSRLAEWVARRAHELGVASTLRAAHITATATGQGLIGMLREELRTGGLDATAVEGRLHARFVQPSFDVRTLAAALEPSLYRRPPLSPAALRQLVLSVVSNLASTRPIILILDDVHLDLAAVEFVDRMLAAQELQARPVLILATLQSEALVDVPEVEALVREVAAHPGVSAITVGPLDASGRQQLVRSLLGLEGALAESIESRTDGNPLFAKQLIGAWVEQQVLVPSADGFLLAPGHSGHLPVDVAEVWASRLADALRHCPPDELEALQLAAAWGTEVVDASWRGSCEVLEIEPRHALIDKLKKRHLIRLHDAQGERWRFVHAALRELLVSQSRRAGHWTPHNLAIAVWLRESGVSVPAAVRAQHFMEAEVFDEALEPLLEAINDQLDAGDLRSVGLLRNLDCALESLGLMRTSMVWAEAQLLRAFRHRMRGELEDAETLALEVVAAARTHHWDEQLGKGLREASRLLFQRGDYERSLSYATYGKRVFMHRGDEVRAADCETFEAHVLVATGKLHDAEAAYEHARLVFEAQAPARVTAPMFGLIRVHQLRGDNERTAQWLSVTHARAQELGLQNDLAVSANLAGELARSEGDFETAASHYREAVERFRSLEQADFIFPLLNLGVLDINASRYDSAKQRMQALLVHLRRNPNKGFLAFTHVILMAALSGLGDRFASQASLRVVLDHVESTGAVDLDIAAMADVTARNMAAHGWDHGAARELAVSQYRELGRSEDADRLCKP